MTDPTAKAAAAWLRAMRVRAARIVEALGDGRGAPGGATEDLAIMAREAGRWADRLDPPPAVEWPDDADTIPLGLPRPTRRLPRQRDQDAQRGLAKRVKR